MEIVHLSLPLHWASALISGDTSGMSKDDIGAVEDFESWMRVYYRSAARCLTLCDDDGFRSWHDAMDFDPRACHCATFSFDISPKHCAEGE